MINYFNTLSFRKKLIHLKKCRFMKRAEFSDGIKLLENKKIVIIGCGAQGLNQGLNMRDSGLNISYVLQKKSILEKNHSWHRAKKNNFQIGTYEQLIPSADLIINLTPDKQHNLVIKSLECLVKKGAILGYSHGFNIVEMGEKIRKDITVIMVAPKCPGTEVREEYQRGFGVPALIAVHSENDPNHIGIEIAKSWAVAIGSHRAGVLHSSFIAEVKSDLMGEQTILCGLLQSASISYYEKLVFQGYDSSYAGKIIQNGWEVITESLKHGGITLMLDRLSSADKIKAYELSIRLKKILLPLFRAHMDNILSGKFSSEMMQDWKKNDQKLLYWRNKTKNTDFENTSVYEKNIHEQEYFENGIFMIAIIKAGIELSFEIMLESGMIAESAYYESLHELPLIANTIARKKLYEMNKVISDTAEYGNYLFSQSAIPLLQDFLKILQDKDLKKNNVFNQINNSYLYNINESIKNHPIEKIGKKLRNYMKDMKNITVEK
ncbi:ketol-acid reductoisomerase [Buchnera aphidicola]|uniref:ketol-acid reductoisomerase n=1 Tax=Buchnera aphidicola TaxID=9 RepID=UPI003463A6B6